MTEGTETPVIDFSILTAEDVPPIAEPVRPDYKASEEKKTPFRGTRRSARKEPETKTTRTVKPAKKAVPNRKGQFVKPLTELYTTVGMVLYVRDDVCGRAIMESAERCAVTLDDLAYQNEVVRRVLFGLVSTSLAGAVIFAHLPIILAIAMHHVPVVKNSLAGMDAETIQNIVSHIAQSQNQQPEPEATEENAA